MMVKAEAMGLTINAKKTKTMQVQQSKGKPLKNKASFKPYESVEEFSYLGTLISSRGTIILAFKALKQRTAQ